MAAMMSVLSAGPRHRVAVLGASSGLGAALALVHARRGDTVLAVARRKSRLEELQREAGATLTSARHWVSIDANLRDPGSVEALGGRLSALTIDRLYLSAAASPPVLKGSITERISMLEEYHRLLFGSYIALTDFLIEAGAFSPRSTVVAVSSLAAVLPFPGLSLYSAGKSALEAWCKARRGRGAPRFAIVRPGLMETEFFTPSSELDLAGLPLGKAARIVAGIDDQREFIDVGGWRDELAGRMSSLVGPRARHIIASRDDFNVAWAAIRGRLGTRWGRARRHAADTATVQSPPAQLGSHDF
jgi:short-subunit dehydrogenase